MSSNLKVGDIIVATRSEVEDRQIYLTIGSKYRVLVIHGAIFNIQDDNNREVSFVMERLIENSKFSCFETLKESRMKKIS